MQIIQAEAETILVVPDSELFSRRYLQTVLHAPNPRWEPQGRNERPNSADSNLRGTQMSLLLLELRRLLLHLLWKLRKCFVCLFAGRRGASERLPDPPTRRGGGNAPGTS